MTAEEAFKVLRDTGIHITDFPADYLQDGETAESVYMTALHKAFDALEKQIPKKPIEEWMSMKFLESIGCKSLHKMCPSCKEIEVCKMDRCCPRCGQAIDWSDAE